jgi:2-C-methyl-D-erythritol 4-phosphate cytidylyltransferase/2-C-methyl-D-erythritol 2,4-cyclodiphosphate synthase
MKRIGQGIDFHRYKSGDHIVLGGVNIPYEKGIEAHSDGDVLVHALMDGLLGAIGKEDIGTYFPDTEKNYKNISSMLLLKQVLEIIRQNKYKIINIDLTLLAEAPRIKPYREQITTNLAKALNIPINRIALKATTTEKMGAIGRSEGIACFALVNLKRNFFSFL